MNKLLAVGPLREMSAVWLKKSVEKLLIVDPETHMNLIAKGFEDQIFSVVKSRGFIEAAREAITDRAAKLSAAKIEVALKSQAAALAANASPEDALAAGQAAAEALKFLHDDVLDKVQRYELKHGGHGSAVDIVGGAGCDGAVGGKKKRKSHKAVRKVAAGRVIEDDDEPDRVARPRGPTKAELVQLCQARKLLTSGSKDELQKRLDAYDARSSVGISNTHRIAGAVMGEVETAVGASEQVYAGAAQAECGAAEHAVDASVIAAHMKRAREDEVYYHSSFEGESFGGDSPLV